MWSNFYAAGGFGMYPTSLFGFLLIAASVLYAWSPAKKTGRLALVLGAVTFSAGLLGTILGMCRSAYYIPQVPFERQVFTLALGCEESLHNLVLALMLVIVGSLVATAGVLRGSTSASLTTAAKTGD